MGDTGLWQPNALYFSLLTVAAVALALTRKWWRWAGWLSGEGLLRFVLRLLAVLIATGVVLHLIRA